MPPVTIHAYQAMRGAFQNPPGMAEGEPLLPPMGNLAADKNRQFMGSGDGTLLVGSQLDAKGQRVQRPASPHGAGRGAGARGGAAGQAGGRGGAAPVDRGPGNGTVFVGSKGYMATGSRGEGVWLLPASRWADYVLPPQVLLRGINHQQDWIRACKGGAPASSNFDYSGPLSETVLMGNLAVRFPGRELLWNGEAMEVTNDKDANAYVRREYRDGWHL
jgi:hypothetical protein